MNQILFHVSVLLHTHETIINNYILANIVLLINPIQNFHSHLCGFMSLYIASLIVSLFEPGRGVGMEIRNTKYAQAYSFDIHCSDGHP